MCSLKGAFLRRGGFGWRPFLLADPSCLLTLHPRQDRSQHMLVSDPFLGWDWVVQKAGRWTEGCRRLAS